MVIRGVKINDCYVYTSWDEQCLVELRQEL